MARIVVGVDGSPEAEQALRWAAKEARLRDATLEVVYAYDANLGVGVIGAALGTDTRLSVQARVAANQLLEDALANVSDVAAGLRVEAEAAAGAAAGVLVGRARGADLLVVGSRGRGGFTGLLLGSVSHQAVHHAECPVAVIRPPE